MNCRNILHFLYYSHARPTPFGPSSMVERLGHQSNTVNCSVCSTTSITINPIHMKVNFQIALRRSAHPQAKKDSFSHTTITLCTVGFRLRIQRKRRQIHSSRNTTTNQMCYM